MPFLGNDSNQTASVGSSTTFVMSAINTTGQIAYAVYDQIAGSSYSSSAIKKLTELKNIYQQTFLVSPPIYWDLDTGNRPTHRLKNQKWLLYARQLRQAKESCNHYHYQSDLIAEYAATYLIERGRRYFGKGKPGDPVEQFFGELIHFSMNDLPTFGSDETSIQRIKNRIVYLERVQKHDGIFKHGTFVRDKNKSDTIENIKSQLKAALEIAMKETARQSAREIFDRCAHELAMMLHATLQTFYYARNTSVEHEPLELGCYIHPDEKFLSTAAQKLYPKLKETHTGKMLYEILSLVGLEPFGSEIEKPVKFFEPRYFSQNGTKQTIEWELAKFDLPPWVENIEYQSVLESFQQIGESILRIVDLKKLVAIAYDLMGSVGDLWAYGDPRGKLSLQALIYILDQETNLLKKHYDGFYEQHHARRHVYNLKHRIDPNKGANPNFNRVDDLKNDLDKSYDGIKAAVHSIQSQIEKFPNDAHKQIDSQKESFYKQIAKYLKQFYPKSCAQYALIMTAETHTSNVSAFHDHRGPSQVIDDSKKSKQFIMPRRYQQLGALFDTWLKHYQQIERQWLNIENSSDCIVENGHDSVDVLLRKMNILRNKINKERPAWRFSLQNVFSWQVGWPFYRNRSHLAALLLDELNHLEKKIEMMIQALKPTAISTACGVVQSTPQSALPVITRLPVDCASSDKNQANLNHDLQQSSSLQDISESNIRSIDEWLGIINSAFSNWQDHEATFKPFESDAQFKKFIDMFLKYRDSLSGEVLHLTIQTWLALIDLLSLEVNDTDELPHESRQQMLLIISLQSLMESDPATELRQTLIENCMSQSRQLFGSRQVVYDLRGSYPSNGLYGQSSGINQYITHTPMYKL